MPRRLFVRKFYSLFFVGFYFCPFLSCRLCFLVLVVWVGFRFLVHCVSRQGELCVALGGRMAEEIVYGADEVTTGASNDIQQVTNVAREMVTKYGFSDVVGNVAVSTESGNPFLGRRIATGGNGWSNRKLEEVDTEVLVRS
mmetsp:Transcript_18998/g.38400  ORF Transcript_18998/g.38400 Transcript_18998/m.38400 type:complete len:141 (+) Transcript_18998:2162-2584(+)